MSCITYFNNESSGLPVYVSGTTCGLQVTAVTLNYGQAICMNDDFEIITCGNADIGAECLPPITPSVTPTISLTPSVTKSPTPTPSVTSPETQTPTPTQTQTQTPTPSVTIGLTPTSTESPTPTPTETPTNTPTITSTPTSTTPDVTSTSTPTTTQTPTNTQTQTPSSTPPDVTPTSTPTGQLFIYARYVNTSQEFGYLINTGSYNAIGTPSSSNCLYVTTISGLQQNDLVSFVTISTCAINGDYQDCPNSAGSCVWNHTFNGTTSIYITVDGSQCC